MTAAADRAMSVVRERVAVVGLGTMGSRIARRLLDGGCDVTVWNRTPEKTAELVERGAARAATPAEAARGAGAVITMVSDPAALGAVTEGPDGVAAGVGPATAVIEMSTVGPAAVSHLRSALPAGTPLLDAPVLGSVAEADAGALTILVGGDAPDVERWTPVLRLLGKPVHVGGPGAGAAAKLVANSTLFAVVAALGEALALADGFGLDREAAYDVLAATPLAAQAERRREAIERGEYPPRFVLSLARKDASLVAEAAAAAGVDVRLANAVLAWLEDAEAAGRGESDYSSVLAQILETRRRS
jgi:3-hydroxyisobutyrate dehydrogenase/2-hydroxy-3-oxopropionate reductase